MLLGKIRGRLSNSNTHTLADANSAPVRNSASRAFEVPDDDNDSYSDVSETDSVAILDSHPRTFSVPSSDDEEDRPVVDVRKPAMSSLPKAIIHNTIGTAQMENVHKDIPSPVELDKGMGPRSIGASQADPINIDEGRKVAIDLDSEDDGPEVIPIKHYANDSQQKKDNTASGSLEELAQNRWPSVHSNLYADSNISEYGDDEDLFGGIEPMQDQDTFLAEKGKDVAGTSRSESVGDTNALQRPSSPSDAAMAKKPFASSDVDLNLEKEAREKDLRNRQEDMDRNESGISSCVFVPSNEPQIRYHNTLQLTGPQENISNHKPVEQNKSDSSIKGSRMHAWDSLPTDSAHVFSSARMNANQGPIAWNSMDYESRNLPPYTVGPFSALPYPGSPAEHVFPATYAGNRGPMWPENSRYYPYSNRQTSLSWKDVDPHPLGYKGAPAPDTYWKRPHNITTAFESHAPTGSPEVSHPRSSFENPARGVPLSDLVNSSAVSLPASRAPKRKASDMSSEPDESLQPSVTAGAQTKPDKNPDSTMLADAQPRDQQIEPESVLTEQATDVQVSTQPASQHAPSKLKDDGRINSSTDAGPARKKIKTSPSKTAGVGKFVSGIAVGVVGVLATLIATIPASVREEALIEFNNVQ